MPLQSLVIDEVKRTPVALFLNGIMTVIAAIGIWIALRQPAATKTVSITAQTQSLKSSHGVWLTIAIFISLTSIGASVVRLTYRVNAWIGLLLSICTAVFSLFVTVWAAKVLGLDVGFSGSGKAFNDLVFYGTMILYLGVAGGRPLTDLARTGYKKPETDADASQEALGSLIAVALAVALWGWLIGRGQSLAVQAFL